MLEFIQAMKIFGRGVVFIFDVRKNCRTDLKPGAMHIFQSLNS
jgi:hypothetical protein